MRDVDKIKKGVDGKEGERNKKRSKNRRKGRREVEEEGKDRKG